ncbi:MAG: SDR family NAD(P)-dependent oxidoreductase [Planctomycetaceae bacterium]|nr:SDR family NAD(P)-dependent oxidoreductase [Planctomycetaceae bacterium]
MENPRLKIAWVVGGSSGLGLTIASELLGKGYRVTLFARDLDRLERARQWLLASDSTVSAEEVRVEVCDAANLDSITRSFTRHFAECGRLDLLVNAVGQSCRSSVAEPNFNLYREMMEVNYFAVVHSTLLALPWLIEQQGSLVNIATLAAKTPWPWIAPYGAAKAAVANFTDNVRLETSDKVHVLLVCPGPIRRDDSGHRYAAQTAGMSESANRPGAGAPVSTICPHWLAKRIVKAIERRQIWLVFPWKVRVLLAVQAISSRLGQWLSKRLTRRALHSQSSNLS